MKSKNQSPLRALVHSTLHDDILTARAVPYHRGVRARILRGDLQQFRVDLDPDARAEIVHNPTQPIHFKRKDAAIFTDLFAKGEHNPSNGLIYPAMIYARLFPSLEEEKAKPDPHFSSLFFGFHAMAEFEPTYPLLITTIYPDFPDPDLRRVFDAPTEGPFGPFVMIAYQITPEHQFMRLAVANGKYAFSAAKYIASIPARARLLGEWIYSQSSESVIIAVLAAAAAHAKATKREGFTLVK